MAKPNACKEKGKNWERVQVPIPTEARARLEARAKANQRALGREISVLALRALAIEEAVKPG